MTLSMVEIQLNRTIHILSSMKDVPCETQAKAMEAAKNIEHLCVQLVSPIYSSLIASSKPCEQPEDADESANLQQYGDN